VPRQYRLGPLRRTVNLVVAASIRLRIGPKSTYLMTTIGRRSGLPRTTPVTLVESDGERWLVSPYGTVSWVNNVRASGQVKVRRGGQTESLRAEEVQADVAGPVLRQYVKRVPVTAPFFDAKREDPVDAFVAEATRHPVFRLSPTGPPG
jgi:deazaflavin-dependent oxidoreductase (nitroreductase family)